MLFGSWLMAKLEVFAWTTMGNGGPPIDRLRAPRSGWSMAQYGRGH